MKSVNSHSEIGWKLINGNEISRENNFDLIRLFAALQVLLGHGINHLQILGYDEILDVISFFPGVAGYIEYKNKTQEKCNYCTIYQCISGFYKKNVELHLLLILAIDSVIYSFYVTILLCKKAPVFD